MIVVTGAVFVAMVSVAYSVDTIPTWNLPTVPVSLWLNALVGGPLLAAFTLYVARWGELAGRFGLALMSVPVVVLFANVAVYAAQGNMMAELGNPVTAAVELVPHYWQMLAAATVLALAGCVLAAATMHVVSRRAGQAAGTPLALSKRVATRLCVACLLSFAGIFVMRFAFYMMRLTVGVAV